MPASKRVQLETARRRAKVAQLYTEGYRQWEIIPMVGLDNSATAASIIHQDLKTVFEDWKEQAREELAERKSKRRAELELVMREAFQAWHKSKVELIETSESLVRYKKNGKMVVGKGAMEEKRKQRNPDSQYLKLIVNCIQELNAMDGITAKTSNDPVAVPPVLRIVYDLQQPVPIPVEALPIENGNGHADDNNTSPADGATS